MADSHDNEPPIIEPSDEVSPEVLRELEGVFGLTPPIGGPIASSDPTPVSPDDAPTVVIESTPVSTSGANDVIQIDGVGDDVDIVYLEDESLNPATGDITRTGGGTGIRIVAGSRFIRLIRYFDPRLRSGRKAIRRLIISIVAAVVLLGAVVIVTTPILSVSTVRIEGATYTNKATLEKATKLLKGKAILTLDTDKALSVLESDPWVREASIDTKLPNKAVIDISERTPRVWFRCTDEKFRVIDEDGRVLAVLAGQPTGFLEVTGIAPNIAAGGVAPDVYTATAQLAMSLPYELASKVARFGVTTAGDITMSLKSGALVKFGQPNDLRQKLISLVVVIRRPGAEKLVLIDVSSEDVVVK